MARKSERKSLSEHFPTTTGDNWLERKRKVDGAEGLWRIHDKIYDFTLWSRVHPGGVFWIEETRGTDVTEVFESHHLSEAPEIVLKKFYQREAAHPRCSPVSFNKNGFFAAFKRKILQEKSAVGSPRRMELLCDCLVTGVFVTGLFGAKYGGVWPSISGVLLGVLATYMHNFLHMKENWRVKYLNLSLMSSREWRIKHVLSHHQFRGTVLDLEKSTWEPFMRLFPEKSGNLLTKTVRQVLSLLMFASSSHFEFSRRFLQVFLSQKLNFDSEEFFGLSLPVFMLMFGGPNLWNTFLVWNFIILTGSFVSSLAGSSSNSISSQISRENSIRDKEDFGVTQLSLAGTHPRENLSAFSIANSYRANVLHYLCPAIDCRRLRQLIPAFEATCTEFGIECKKTDPKILEGLFDGGPQGNVSFS